MARGQTLSNQQNSYYPGQTYVGSTDAEQQAWQSRTGYNDSVFNPNTAPGAAPSNALNYRSATGYLNNTLQGGSQLNQMAGQMSGAPGAVNQAFSPYDIGGRFDALQGPQGQIRDPNAQAGQIGQYGFGTSLDAQGRAPQFGQAGSLDATGAYNRMLSGQPDYQGAQGAIDAANAPILRQLNEEIIPGLNQKATFTNNMTGGIKGLNTAIPQVAQRMGENAQNIMNQERVRALDQQERAAGQVAQGGLQGYGLGLQTAQGERGLEQSQAGMNLSADQARANLGQQDNQMGLQTDMARYGMSQDQSNFGLQREQAREQAMGGYRSDALGYGSLAGQMAGQASTDQARAAAMFPSIYDVGRQPGNDQLAYANYDRAIREDELQGNMDRYNYNRDQPYDQLAWYSNLINGTASPYGSQSQTGPAGSRAAGALGGAAAGYGLTSQFTQNPWINGIGALVGGFAGYQ